MDESSFPEVPSCGGVSGIASGVKCLGIPRSWSAKYSLFTKSGEESRFFILRHYRDSNVHSRWRTLAYSSRSLQTLKRSPRPGR